jgi:hypothetical protein
MKTIHGKTKDGIAISCMYDSVGLGKKTPCVISVDRQDGFMFRPPLSEDAVKAVMAAVPSVKLEDMRLLVRRMSKRLK